MQPPPPEVTAARHPCPECGGEMVWDPAKQKLACPYCGFVPKEQPSAGPQPPGLIVEHDLYEALARTDSQPHGYGQATTSVRCQNCNAVSVFEPNKVAQRCPFCGSPAIVPYQQDRDPISPESLLPVRLAEPQVRDLLRNWYSTRWFAPTRLKSAALTDTLHAIYLPYWTFDAQAYARWSAESGDYYYVTETYRDSQGNTQTRQVQRVRWYPSAGSLDHFFNDELVPGTVGVRHDLLRKIEPFPTAELKPYDPAFVRGWTVERYQIDLRNAAGLAQQSMDQKVYSMCDRQVPGDTHRNLQVNTRYANQTFKHILTPVWLVTYTFGPKTFQVLVNGFTGTIAGDRPTSWVKVFFYIILPSLIAIAIIVVIVMAQK